MFKLFFAASFISLAVAASFGGDKKYGTFNLCTDGGCLYNANGEIKYSHDKKSCFDFVHYDRESSAGDDRSLVCVGNGQPTIGLRFKGAVGDYCTWVADKRGAEDAALITDDGGKTYTYHTLSNGFCGSNIGRDGGSANQGSSTDSKFTITPCVC